MYTLINMIFFFLYVTLKGIVSRDEYKGLYNTCNIKQMVSVHVLMVFTIFCFLVDEIIELKVLACSFEITY
jgi:hypothetical protein